jgi:hypothetical protein
MLASWPFRREFGIPMWHLVLPLDYCKGFPLLQAVLICLFRSSCDAVTLQSRRKRTAVLQTAIGAASVAAGPDEQQDARAQDASEPKETRIRWCPLLKTDNKNELGPQASGGPFDTRAMTINTETS